MNSRQNRHPIESIFNKHPQSQLEARKHINKVIFGLTGILIFWGIWELGLRIYISFYPSSIHILGFLPEAAFSALIRILGTSFFWSSLFASLSRIFLGLLIAGLIGIPFGMIIGISPVLRYISTIPIQFVRMISPISWMPIALIFLPGFEEAILFLIVITCVWPIILSTKRGVQEVDPAWINMAKTQGAGQQQLLFRVILPATLPSIISGIQLALGVAWVILVPAEFLGISSGLGYLINDARNTLEYDTLMALVLAIGLIGFTMNAIVSLISRRVNVTSP